MKITRGKTFKIPRSINRVDRNAAQALTGRIDTERAARDQQASASLVTQEQIKLRAYELLLSRGGAHGDDWLDWFQAEREVGK